MSEKFWELIIGNFGFWGLLLGILTFLEWKRGTISKLFGKNKILEKINMYQSDLKNTLMVINDTLKEIINLDNNNYKQLIIEISAT